MGESLCLSNKQGFIKEEVWWCKPSPSFTLLSPEAVWTYIYHGTFTTYFIAHVRILILDIHSWSHLHFERIHFYCYCTNSLSFLIFMELQHDVTCNSQGNNLAFSPLLSFPSWKKLASACVCRKITQNEVVQQI